jgi:murein DD-endopeptidase MepM/ murein hydrolase activator NlpD
MPASVVSLRARNWARAAAIAVIAIGAAGCSDSGRFEINDPFASTPPRDVTGSVAARPAPASRVASAPLPAPSRPRTVAASGVTQGAGGLGAYRPPASQGSQDITGSVTRPQPSGHWTWEGGTPIVVGADDSVESIGRKYGVPAAAIMQANNLTSASALRPGQRLVIPRYVSSAVASHSRPAPSRPAVAAAQPASAAARVHVVAPGETLMALSRKYHVSLSTLAKANNIPPFTKVSIGDRITIPGGHAAQVRQARAPQVTKPEVKPTVTPHVAQKVEPPAPAKERKVASAVPTAPVATVPATENARIARAPAQSETAAKAAEPTGAMPSFRWPVHGRIISAFGRKPNGAQNDGINVAVPVGTPVKAADDGVVAYAGVVRKGYGNLVLVRHSNGYVSAYANASELLVKRGDTVKRGQTIARAGQTGNVSSPQLHFEIRKGSTPVDPTRFLGGSNG